MKKNTKKINKNTEQQLQTLQQSVIIYAVVSGLET